MTTREDPVVTLKLSRPRNLDDVAKWVALAHTLDLPSDATVEIDGVWSSVALVHYLDALEDPRFRVEDDES